MRSVMEASQCTPVMTPRSPEQHSELNGKRVAMVTFSPYPADPRPRRAAAAFLQEGMTVDLICLGDAGEPKRETLGGLRVLRLPIKHRRGGKFSYAYNYSAFILICAIILAVRSLRRRYDLIHVHNMPDILVVSSLVPKLLGAKVLLDLHDPMPELMVTIFNLDKNSRSVRLMRWLEKWSIAWADLVFTVNQACVRIFTSRSCRPEKIAVVMNSPDEKIFGFQEPKLTDAQSAAGAKRFVIMYHGSLVERNGVDLAVKALDRVRTKIHGVELRIYGKKTPFLEKVMSEVHTNGLEGWVTYLGPKSLEELVGEIAACDLGVIPNHRSAFSEINTPTRIFEYLAGGKPVIAPRAAGICDYFADDALFFFELGNAEDLAEKIQYVYGHPEETFETARRGQAVYLEHCWPVERQRLTARVATLLTERAKDLASEGQISPSR